MMLRRLIEEKNEACLAIKVACATSGCKCFTCREDCYNCVKEGCIPEVIGAEKEEENE